jgi:hypothetical protein
MLTRNHIVAAAGAALFLLVFGAYLGRSARPATLTATAPAPLPAGDAGPLSDEQRMLADQMSRAAMEFVFFHELGHMVISELKIPAIGPQEDVADEFATYALTDALKAAPDAQKDLYAGIVYSGAVFWRIAGQAREQKSGGAGATGGIAWFDEHSPDLRRYFNILCLATGADPLRFIPMAVKDGVPESRLHSCAEEYKTKHAAWDALMAPHVPGVWRRTFGVHHLKLEVGPVGKPEWQPFEAAYTQGGYFEQMLNGVSSAIDLPEDIPVVVKSCNVVNAFWSPEEKRITLCHEFFQGLMQTFSKAIAAEAQQEAQGGGAPAPQPAGGTPSPTGPPPADPLPSDTYRDPDGRFTVRIPQGWQAQRMGADQMMIARGAAYVQIVTGQGFGTPQQTVQTLVQQIAPQWSQVQPGPATATVVGGRPGFYHTLSGLNPKGVPSRLFVSAAPMGQGSIATITSVPQAEFDADKAAFQFIEGSFVIGGGAPAPAPLTPTQTPAPAGAQAATGAGLEWIKGGLRITYYAASAMVNGAHTEMVLDDKGEWIIVETGKINAEVEKDSRASGQGYLQVNVADVSGDIAALEIRSYGLDVGTGTIMLPTLQGWVGSLKAGNDYWMNPAELRQMKDQKTKGMVVTRLPCTLNGHTYNAIRIHTQADDGSMQKTYDLETGVLLLAGVSSAGGNVRQRDPTNMVHSVPGGTSLGQMRLMSIRPVSLPWNDLPAPDWVSRTPSMAFAGAQSVVMQGVPTTTIPLSVEFTFTRTGPRWAQLNERDTTQGVRGMPAQESSTVRVVGTSQTAGLWVPPEVFARLKPGTIDEDPITHARLVFVGVRGDTAQFTENGPQTTFQYAYNRTTGGLVEFAQSMRVGPATMHVQASLQRR